MKESAQNMAGSWWAITKNGRTITTPAQSHAGKMRVWFDNAYQGLEELRAQGYKVNTRPKAAKHG